MSKGLIFRAGENAKPVEAYSGETKTPSSVSLRIWNAEGKFHFQDCGTLSTRG